MDHQKKIEFFWSQPSGEGPFPVVFLLHDDSFTLGAKDFSQDTLAYWVSHGIIAASISLPGFGKSDGSVDVLEAVKEVISFLSLQSFVKKDRLAVIGFGTGGHVAELLLNSELNLSYIILFDKEPNPEILENIASCLHINCL